MEPKKSKQETNLDKTEPKKVQARNESGQNGTRKWLYNIQEVNFLVKMKPESGFLTFRKSIFWPK